jgi:hypothetical protein
MRQTATPLMASASGGCGAQHGLGWHRPGVQQHDPAEGRWPWQWAPVWWSNPCSYTQQDGLDAAILVGKHCAAAASCACCPHLHCLWQEG